MNQSSAAAAGWTLSQIGAHTSVRKGLSSPQLKALFTVAPNTDTTTDTNFGIAIFAVIYDQHIAITRNLIREESKVSRTVVVSVGI